MERLSYIVTDLAGTHVAGRRIEDRTAALFLTEAEARMELLAGTIRLAERPLPPVSDEEKVGEATGKERVGIPGPVAGVTGEAALGDPDERPAKRSKRR
jgi:hypothetical protein